jgi:pyruvate/2-oxoglutarate dehydrogenase complex dihydrolipoamide acyltransferase (E2) component
MIKNKLREDIESYCKLNGIDDIEDFINKIIMKGFTIEKYGELKPREKTKVEKEEEIGDDYDPTNIDTETIENKEEDTDVVKEEPKPVKVRVSPHAQKLIDKYELDVEMLLGTGKSGGITKKDVEKYLSENGIEKREGSVIIRETIREVKHEKRDLYDEGDFGHHGSNLLDIKK